MANLYMLLDTQTPGYSKEVAALAAILGPSFRPRLSLDSSQALVQVKEIDIGDTVKQLNTVVDILLGIGDSAWVQTFINGEEWSSPPE